MQVRLWRRLSILGVVLAVALASVFVACGPDAATPTDAPAASEESALDRTGWPAKVRLGLIPTEANVLADWTPVVEHLAARLGLEVEVFVGADYAATIAAARNGDVDIVQLGPTAYVEARALGTDIKPVVKWVNADSGLAGYNSLLITHMDSGITTVEGARGRTFAFNDPESASGFLVPSVFFLERNIDPESYFSEVSFAGSHEATALAVANGDVDLASNNNETLPRLFETGKVREDDIRIIWTSALIPTDPISVQNSLPESFHTAVKEAFLSFDDPAALDVLRIQGWIPAEDGDYEIIRTLEATKARLAGVSQEPGEV